MANTKSAAKRARQTLRRTAINRRVKNKVKAALRSVKETIASGDKAKAAQLAVETQSTLDRAVKTGQIHRNKSARQKSRISRALAAMK